MGQLPENNTDRGDLSAATPEAAATPAASLGKMLREARERNGLSVADVAAQIKFAPRQIEALEADDFMRLPEVAFLRGFVRSYAKILHLDAQALLDALPQSKKAEPELMAPPVNVPFPVAHPSQQQNMILLGAASLIAVIVTGFAVWHFKSPLPQPSVEKIETPVTLPADLPSIPTPEVPKQEVTKQEVTKQEKTAPSIAAETKPRTSASTNSSAQATKPAVVQSVPKVQATDSLSQSDSTMSKVKLHLVFDVESWTEIRDKDGTILSARVHEPGTEMRLGGQPPLALVIGRAGSVHLFKNGEPVDLTPYINSSSEVARLTLE